MTSHGTVSARRFMSITGSYRARAGETMDSLSALLQYSIPT
jgi:hypothetical protein